MLNHIQNVKVKKAHFYKDGDDYYVNVTYIVENLHRIIEYNVPRVKIPLVSLSGSAGIRHNREEPVCYGLPYRDIIELIVGENKYPIEQNENAVWYTEKVIKEKTQKMTVAEIEKMLGYKIEIVSEKE